MTIDMIGILQTVIAGLVLAAVVGILKINQKLYQLNGSIGTLKTWTEQHEKLDTDRFEEERRWRYAYLENKSLEKRG